MTEIVEFARRQLTLRTHRIHALPVLVLMPHSRCNCRCVMCDIWKANAAGSEIEEAELRRHTEDMRRLGVRWVVLSGGEALMHRNLWALCAALRELGVRITLLSTGLLLARNAEDVVRWTDEVIVSLDGSPAVHDSIRRVPRAFERLAEGVAALRAARPGFRVTARSVLQRQNYDDLPNIVEAARALGLDQISFLAADVSSEAFNRPGGWDGERASGVALTPAEAAELAAAIEALVESRPEDFASGFIAESPDKLRRLPAYYAAIGGAGELPEVRCNAPWVSSVVEADGTVRPCFFHAAIGNIHERPLGEILNSPEAIAFRRGLDVRANPICRRCVCTLQL
jgi:MoaA/NifB/PqqE/SkfB family radical SAM enzyme